MPPLSGLVALVLAVGLRPGPVEPSGIDSAALERSLEAAVERGDVAGALDLAGSLAAARESERAGDTLGLADALAEVARLVRPLAKPEADALAESLLLRSLRLRREVQGPDRLEQTGTMEQLSELYFYAGRWKEAEAIDRSVLDIRRAALGPDHPDVGQSCQNVALNLYYHARLREAEALFRESLRIYEKVEPSPPLELAYALNYLAEDLRAQNRYAEAEPLFERGLRVAAEGVPAADRLVLMGNLSGLYRDTQRLAEAQWYARQALDLAERSPGVPASSKVSYLLNLAELYRMQGDPDLAEPVYARALEAARQAFRPDHPRIGTVLNQMAVNFVEQGSYAQAEGLFRESAGIKLKEWGPESPDLANSYHDLGLLLERLDRTAEAEEQLRRALAIREKSLGPAHPSVALCLLALAGLVERSPSRARESLALLDRTVRILDATPAEPRAHAHAYAQRAVLRRAQGERGPARADLARALEIVEAMRPEAGGAEQTRARFLARYADDFQRMVAWQVDEGDLAEAIRYAERARGRVLLDQLASAGVDLRAGILPEERRSLEARETDVRARLAEYRSRLEKLYAANETSEEARARIAALERDEARATAEFETLYQEIKNASRFWRGRAGLGDVVGLADLRRELVPRDGLVLYYSVGAERSFLFVIPPRGQRPRAWPLAVPAAAATALAVDAGPVTRGSLRRMLAPGPEVAGGLLARLAEPPRAARRTAVDARLHALFEVLMPAAAWPLVRGAAEVVVVPDDLIHQVPFEALVVRPVGTEAKTHYWLDVGPVVRYAASATVAHALALRSAAPRGGDVVLSASDPIFDREEVRRLSAVDPGPVAPGGPGAPLGGGWDLVRLPGTAREAQAIRAAFEDQGQPVVLLQQFGSRESAVRSHLPSARYIHLATHGLVDESRSGLFASLALTPPPDEAGPDDDGQLQLFEIYGLDLTAELAVLSSCQSRVGTLVPGEGVFALSRAFMASGVRRVVASLWPAADDATAALMGSFFRAVARGGRRGGQPDFARALAQAKREVRRQADWSEPFFWAPFVLDGPP